MTDKIPAASYVENVGTVISTITAQHVLDYVNLALADEKLEPMTRKYLCNARYLLVAK